RVDAAAIVRLPIVKVVTPATRGVIVADAASTTRTALVYVLTGGLTLPVRLKLKFWIRWSEFSPPVAPVNPTQALAPTRPARLKPAMVGRGSVVGPWVSTRLAVGAVAS